MYSTYEEQNPTTDNNGRNHAAWKTAQKWNYYIGNSALNPRKDDMLDFLRLIKAEHNGMVNDDILLFELQTLFHYVCRAGRDEEIQDKFRDTCACMGVFAQIPGYLNNEPVLIGLSIATCLPSVELPDKILNLPEWKLYGRGTSYPSKYEDVDVARGHRSQMELPSTNVGNGTPVRTNRQPYNRNRRTASGRNKNTSDDTDFVIQVQKPDAHSNSKVRMSSESTALQEAENLYQEIRNMETSEVDMRHRHRSRLSISQMFISALVTNDDRGRIYEYIKQCWMSCCPVSCTHLTIDPRGCKRYSRNLRGDGTEIKIKEMRI